ncbi:glycosyltransferase family 4 protein [Pontibacter qinzhouensis]|uniref:Glycosyltransferase family 4 protein n=1 Tax=Pontibacter qinzhouensis TaxID=2603253 RepID=A0A5C8K8N0_9BACT|nr:glycosyltransferase family 4 protein [Pontibacter qinzhouensis]TXK46977.1 glycosyltransferase family 4 protein [Pontibacter qinzhouensis]
MKKKTRILLTIDWFLPGYKAGGPIRSCANLVDHLKEEFEFFILTRNTDYNSTEPFPGIEPDTWQKLYGITIYYFSSGELSYRTLKHVMKEVQPDIIYINGIFSRYFSLYPLLISRSLKARRVIVAGRGMFAPGAREVKGGKKQLFFKIARYVGLYKSILFHATNELEAGHIRQVLGKKTPVIMASNLAAKYNGQGKSVSLEKKVNQLRLVSFARISPEKNTRYGLEVLASNRFEGEITYDLFGQINDTAYWNSCLEIIKVLPANIQVTYRGSIDNTEVPAALQQYHALFLPTKGENFGHVILESLTASLPVIISDKTPWRNLHEAGVGFDLPLEQPNKFHKAIENLLKMPQENFITMQAAVAKYALEVLQDEETLTANIALFSLE